jgi:hypothetical protein
MFPKRRIWEAKTRSAGLPPTTADPTSHRDRSLKPPTQREVVVTYIIMPSFNSAEREGSLIGRLLAGYGEPELEMAACAMAARLGPLG